MRCPCASIAAKRTRSHHTAHPRPTPAPRRYDQAVYSVDFCERLGFATLPYMNTLEATMLRLLEFDTAVPRALYVKYYFALQELMVPSTQHTIIPKPSQDCTGSGKLEAASSSPAGHHRRTRSAGDSMQLT